MDVTPPKDDADYFGRMHKAIFSAGLSWAMVEKKWPNFTKPFEDFHPERIAKFTQTDVKRLMNDQGIIRNEQKIRAVVYNAKEFVRLHSEFGSFGKYVGSFGKDEERLLGDLQARFHHLGPSSARMFLWSVGYPLTPTAEEKKWMASHDM